MENIDPGSYKPVALNYKLSGLYLATETIKSESQKHPNIGDKNLEEENSIKNEKECMSARTKILLFSLIIFALILAIVVLILLLTIQISTSIPRVDASSNENHRELVHTIQVSQFIHCSKSW